MAHSKREYIRQATPHQTHMAGNDAASSPHQVTIPIDEPRAFLRVQRSTRKPRSVVAMALLFVAIVLVLSVVCVALSKAQRSPTASSSEESHVSVPPPSRTIPATETPLLSSTAHLPTALPPQSRDSNTEFASNPDNLGFQVLFTYEYVGKADTMNRGHRGWTSRNWVAVLPTLAQEFSRPPSLVVVFLGTNDASTANGSVSWTTAVHVPLDEFQANLRTLATAFQSEWGSRVLFVTALPFNDVAPAWLGTRTNADTGRYAAAMMATGHDLDVPVVDLWTPLQDKMATIFYDGLHLNREGNVNVHARMRDAIAAAYPDLAPDNLPAYY
ncbi:Aste57867_12236 [Aphanomyces stellatus]|uniref:Aste57867_12236 protein n=1 Tax=Aphanomyces stellatus TaxID=120398 RepID=A0A485KX17_9STRA|nr:hypothetical protein As57867_012191 [Aphanomyces stellatus]VFT89090.1 Aste57867_12236 [Aphanomyces stellatus]